MLAIESGMFKRWTARIFSHTPCANASVHRVLLVLVLLLVGGLLFLPIWYSCHTPFGLVDDYGDWLVTQQFNSGRAWVAWAKATFVGEVPRFRPFFEMYNWFAWQTFGPRPAAHHLARWLMLAVSVGFGTAVICWGSRRLHAFRAWKWLYLLLFSALFLFHPNQPVSRLGPQELPSVMFLAMGVFSILCVLRSTGASLANTRGSILLLLMISYLGMAFAKETNVALLAWFLLWQCCVHARPFRLKTASLLLGQAGIFAFVCWRVWTIKQQASYGAAPLTGTLVFNNLVWIVGDGLRLRLSWIATVGIVVLVVLVVARLLRSLIKRDGSTDELLLLFLLGSTVAVGVMALTSWHPVPRYLYPFVFLLAMLVCWGGKMLLVSISDSRRVWVGGVLTLWSLFVLFAQSHNYLYQFVAQSHARQVDQLYLDELSRLTEEGKSIGVGYGMKDPDIELVWQTHVYMNQLRPHFHGKDPVVGMDIQNSPTDHDWMVSPRKDEPSWQTVTRWGVNNQYRVLSWTQKCSALLQFRKFPYVYLDAGVHDLNYAWYLHGRGEP